MKWNKYSIQTTTEAVDFISSMLGELGIEGIEIEDNVQLTQEEAKTMFVDFIPDLPPDDGSAKVNFYIDSDEDDNTIMDSQGRSGRTAPVLQCRCRNNFRIPDRR